MIPTTRKAYQYKIALDGLDFSESQLGKAVMNDTLIGCVKEVGMIDVQHLSDFVEYCVFERRFREPDHLLPVYLRDKYQVGLFTVSEQNCFNSKYVLFNRDWLNIWHDDETPMWGLTFLTIPSYDRDGKLNEIGFRLLDTSVVDNAIKWLFAAGQQATFGLDRCDPNSRLILVEGAWDHIALAESGINNSVGLGSVFITRRHQKFLGDQRFTFCLDQDHFGIAQRAEHADFCFFMPEAKDPFDAFIRYGRVEIVEVRE